MQKSSGERYRVILALLFFFSASVNISVYLASFAWEAPGTTHICLPGNKNSTRPIVFTSRI